RERGGIHGSAASPKPYTAAPAIKATLASSLRRPVASSLLRRIRMADSAADRPKAKSLKPLRELWPYLRKYKGILVFALFALVIASGAMLTLPVAFKGVIDQGMVVQDRATIDFYFVAFLAAAIVFGVFAALRFYLVTWLGERVVADLRADIYARVIRMDPTFF